MYVKDDSYALIDLRAEPCHSRHQLFSRGIRMLHTTDVYSLFKSLFIFYFISPYLKLVSRNLLIVRPGYPKVREEK